MNRCRLPIFSTIFALAFIVILIYAPGSQAQRLPNPPNAPFADSLRQNFRVDPCCGAALERCAKEKPQCAIAPRLMNFLAWMDSTKQIPDDRMGAMMQERYNVFTDTKRHAIDHKGWPVIGDPNAPLTLSMFYSVTCPTCKSNFVELYAATTNGPLKGRVKIVAKPFSDIPQNRAAAAAQDLGRYAEFMLALAQAHGRIDEAAIYAIVDKMRMDKDKFSAAMENPALISRIQRSAEEARKMGLQYVPTYFIAGRQYEGSVAPRWVMDAIDFVWETEFKDKK